MTPTRSFFQNLAPRLRDRPSIPTVSGAVALLFFMAVAMMNTSCAIMRKAEPTYDPTDTSAPVATVSSFNGPNDPAWALPRKLLPGADERYFGVKVTEPYIALTIDDGPTPHTGRVLDYLKARRVKATFFVIGEPNARANPAIIRRQLAEGHELGNHTTTHRYLTKISDAGVADEIRGCNDVLQQIASYTPQVVRPPGGFGGYGSTADLRIRDIIKREFAMPLIMWNVDPQDIRDPGTKVIADRMIKTTRPGSILLCHDTHRQTVEALPIVIDTLLAKGFRFVTVSQLINLSLGAKLPESAGGSAGQSGQKAQIGPMLSFVNFSAGNL
jgi:peptidoglycan-N-acetylglucosamine deacetylase